MFGKIPTKILKRSSKSCSDTLQKLLNSALRHGNFSDKLKCADVTPIFKKMIQQVFYQEVQNLLKTYSEENLVATLMYKISEQRNIQYNFHSQTDFQLR